MLHFVPPLSVYHLGLPGKQQSSGGGSRLLLRTSHLSLVGRSRTLWLFVIPVLAHPAGF